MTRSLPTAVCLWFCAALLAATVHSASGQEKAVQTPPSPGPQSGRAAPGSKPSPPSFTQLKTQAEAARDNDQIPEAIAAYSRLVKLRPGWHEGWWFLGTLQYESDQYAPALSSFRRYVALAPKNGYGWSMLGLCEFRQTQYAAALQSLVKGRRLGIAGNEELARVARYHLAVLYNMGQQFEAAQELLMGFAHERRESQTVLIALGQSLLRIAEQPERLKPAEKEVARKLGKAAFFTSDRNPPEANRILDDLLAARADFTNLYYACGVIALMQKDSERAVGFFEKELARTPNHFSALMQIAFKQIELGKFSEALPFVERALPLQPQNFTVHYALGRIHLELGEIAKSVAALEKAAAIAPQTPSVQFILARAYSRAQRPADAARARAEFARLEALDKQRRGEAVLASNP